MIKFQWKDSQYSRYLGDYDIYSLATCNDCSEKLYLRQVVTEELVKDIKNFQPYLDGTKEKAEEEHIKTCSHIIKERMRGIL